MSDKQVITSRGNPYVKRLDALLRQKQAREESGLFVLEGARLCLDAIQAGLPVESVCLTPSAFERYPSLADLTRSAPQVVWVSETLAGRLGDTQNPQGVFAVLPAASLPVLEKAEAGGRYLLLHRVRDPGNLGGILRTAAALGASGAFLCASAEPTAPKVLRASMGGVFRLPLMPVGDMAEQLRLLDGLGIRTYAAAAREEASAPHILSEPGGKGVLIGNEGSGLPEELIAACTHTVAIPMKTGSESLNAAMAAGILMWEMLKGN